MDQIKPYLSWVGGLLVLYGIISIVLWFTPYEIRAFWWINSWTVTISWIFRIGFIVVGAALFFLFKEKD